MEMAMRNTSLRDAASLGQPSWEELCHRSVAAVDDTVDGSEIRWKQGDLI